MPAAIWPRFTLPIWTLGTAGLSPTSSLAKALLASSLAIWKRVDQYGITERRYFLIVLSLWLAGIAVYYTVRRSRSIAVIPARSWCMSITYRSGLPVIAKTA